MENKDKILKVELELSFPKLTWNIFSSKRIIILKATIYKGDGCIIKLPRKKWCGLFFAFHEKCYENLKNIILEYLNNYLESKNNGILSIKDHVREIIINYPRYGYYVRLIEELINSRSKKYIYNYEYGEYCRTKRELIIDNYVFFN